MGSGAQADIDMASKLVRRMVTQWGMSEALGPISFGERDELIFLGREIQQHQDYSEKTAEQIDEEVKRIVTECYDRAKKILEDKIDVLHRMAHELLERETLDREDIELLFKGEELPPVKKRHAAASPVKPAAAEKEKTSEARTQFPGKPQPLPRPNTP